MQGDEYALPIEQVQEIIRYSEPREVSSGKAWVRGVISLRGKIIPVCDLSIRLGKGADTDGANIIIAETSSGTTGLIVDQVEEVLTIENQQLDNAPGINSDLISTIAKVDGRLIFVIEAEQAFGSLE